MLQSNKSEYYLQKILVLLLCLLSSCLLINRDHGTIVSESEVQVYSSPYWKAPRPYSKRYKRIIIAATNDTLGYIGPQIEVINDQEEKQKMSYRVGGLAILSRYLEILRQKFQNKILFLDAGNIYKGTLIPQKDKGESIVKIYNQFNYDAMTIGNHDLQFEFINDSISIEDINQDHQRQLKKNISLHKAPHVMSNIIDIAATKLISWNNTSPYIIKKVNGVKVAIIGGISSSAWKMISKENLRGLYIRDLGKSLLKYSQLVKEKGAEVIIAIVHAEGSCGQELMREYNLNSHQVNVNFQNKSTCDHNNEIFRVIKQLPKGTVHALITGGSQSKIANFFMGTPIIQSFSHGLFLGRMELIYDSVKKRVDVEKTRIYPPIKLCYQFFKPTQDCYRRENWDELPTLIPATFLGELVYPHSHIDKMIKNYNFQIKSKLAEKIIKIKNWKLSDLESIIPYSIRKATNSQVSFTAFISRSNISNGKKDAITYQDIYRVLPHGDHLAKVSISGKKLRELVEVATAKIQTHPGQFSGLKIVLHKKSLKQRDINKDGKNEDWERSRVKSIKLSNGEPISDNIIYTIGTHTFFSENSSGNYSFIFSSISKNKKITFRHKTNRQALLDLLRSFSSDQKQLRKIIQKEKDWIITI